MKNINVGQKVRLDLPSEHVLTQTLNGSTGHSYLVEQTWVVHYASKPHKPEHIRALITSTTEENPRAIYIDNPTAHLKPI